MSDGLNDARRAGEIADDLESSSMQLASAIGKATDPMFGVSDNVLELVNEELKELGLKIVRKK